MEGKIIIGIISALILVITVNFLNSENLTRSQKVILFCLIIFPPAQWILGMIFLNLNKNVSNQKISKKEIISNKKEKKLNFTDESNEIKLKESTTNGQESFREKQSLLEKSLEMNLITKTEFESKIENLEKEKIEKEKKNKELEVVKAKKITLNELYENKIITKEELTLKIEELNENLNYKITEETKGWSLMTGNYIEYFISFKNRRGSVLYISKKDKYSFSKTDGSEYFDNLDNCILGYKKYLGKK